MKNWNKSMQTAAAYPKFPRSFSRPAWSKYNLILMLVVSIPLIFSGCSDTRKHVGVYQYVRKAQRYMENKKYDKAMYFLHQAYETVPDNKDIEDQLLYGYIRYARFLEENKELDRAIEEMEKAYEMNDNNMAVMHELAYLYVKKSVKESSEKNIGEALEMSLKAVDIAFRSSKVRKSISIYFFNEAVEAFNKNDDETVLLSLSASYVLMPVFRTLDLLGRYYYKKGNPERALFYWNKAATIKSGNEELNNNISKARKELELRKKQKTIETEYFNIEFYRDYNINAEKLGETLKRIYDEVGSDFDFYPPRNTPIVLYDEKDFRDIFKQSGIVRAFYDGGSIRMALNIGIDDPLFPAIMAHEYTHAVISILTDNKCPVWLHEGLAVFEQSRYMKPSLHNLVMKVKQGRRFLLDEVEGGFSESEESKLALSYESAHTAVLFILDTWGWTGIRGLLNRMKNGRHYVNALDEEFYVTRDGFERMWNEYLTGMAK